MQLAALTNRLPAEIDAMPYVESLAFLEAKAEQETNRRKWEAAVAGIKI